MEVAVRVEAIDLADRVIRAHVERRSLGKVDVVDRLHRTDGIGTLMPRPVVLERLDRLRRVEITDESDTIRTDAGKGWAVLLPSRAAQDAVFVVTLIGALAPAQTP